MDLHHNLFYGYRGPGTDADRDQQLENNVTKALINTLRLGGTDVWRRFLAWVGITDARDAEFLLQRCHLPSGGAARRRRRVLLGISKGRSSWSPDACEDMTSSVAAVSSISDSLGALADAPEGSRPHAWVYGDGFVVLVESKVGDNDFSPRQMAAHLARLGTAEQTRPKVVLRTWRDVHGFFHGLLPSLADTSSRLLVEQFIQFLEYSDMSGFTGFQREHFGYFLLHHDDDARRWVHGRVKDFAARVQTRLYEFDSSTRATTSVC
jgi:hypothetical protein